MNTNTQIPVLYEADVLVVGAGPSGFASAVSASRKGAYTVLVERGSYCGGYITMGVDPTLSFVDDRVQGGLVKELVTRIREAGMMCEPDIQDQLMDCKSPWGAGTGNYFFDCEYLKLLMEQMLQEAGVRLLYNAHVTDVLREGEMITGVVVDTPGGNYVIACKTLIDCSGGAYISQKAGAECTQCEGLPDDRYGEGSKGMNLSFGMGTYFDHVDYDKYCEFIKNQPYYSDFTREELAQARKAGELYIRCTSIGTRKWKDGRMYVIGIGLPVERGKKPFDPEVITDATLDMRRQAWSIMEYYKKHIPGCENLKILRTADLASLAETRRLVGRYTLTEDDVNEHRTHADSVAVSNMFPDIWYPHGDDFSSFWTMAIAPYDVPYRCLISRNYKNLLAAGTSGSWDTLVSTAMRYAVPCICVGQAAGTAAAMAAAEGITPDKIDVGLLQQNLKKQGMVVTNRDFPEELVQEYLSRKWSQGL